MKHFLLIMHTDIGRAISPVDWESYIRKLQQTGNFNGGSSVGQGQSFKKGVASETVSHWIGGYMVISAEDHAQARSLIDGNPVFAAGGTVELRDLPED